MKCKICNKKDAFARDKCWECLVDTEITEEQAKELIEKLQRGLE
jgi:hypothetical protein